MRLRVDALHTGIAIVGGMDAATIERLAELVVGFGANVQRDQIVAVTCEPGKEDLTRAIAASAYRRGAKFVDVAWFDPWIKRARVEPRRARDSCQGVAKLTE